MPKIRDYFHESKTVVRHGEQFYHLHQGLKKHSEAEYISSLATEYHAAGRVRTLAEGMVLAGAVITAYRSNEAGERVPQRARARLDGEEREGTTVEKQHTLKGA